jgi:hypothetical protein
MCPNVLDILRSAGPDLAVRGRVLYFSDAGHDENGFAVMDVEGIASPMVVPVECLRNFTEELAARPVDATDTVTPELRNEPELRDGRLSVSRVEGA